MLTGPHHGTVMVWSGVAHVRVKMSLEDLHHYINKHMLIIWLGLCTKSTIKLIQNIQNSLPLSFPFLLFKM